MLWFHPTQRPVKLRHTVIVGYIVSARLMAEWQQLPVTCSAPSSFQPWLNQWPAQLPQTLADFIGFCPIDICLYRHQLPESLTAPSPSPLLEPGAHTSGQYRPLWLQDCKGIQTTPPQLTPTTVYTLKLAPPSCVPTHCWSNAPRHCHGSVRLCSYRSTLLQPSLPQLHVGLDSTLSPVIALHH